MKRGLVNEKMRKSIRKRSISSLKRQSLSRLSSFFRKSNKSLDQAPEITADLPSDSTLKLGVLLPSSGGGTNVLLFKSTDENLESQGLVFELVFNEFLNERKGVPLFVASLTSFPLYREIDRLAKYGIASIGNGQTHRIVVTNDGGLWGEGSNTFGELDGERPLDGFVSNGEKRMFRIEQSVLSNKNIVRAACGGQHSLCITKDGLVISFGRNEHGQLGHKGSSPRMMALGKVRALHVACGARCSYVLTTTGRLLVVGELPESESSDTKKELGVRVVKGLEGVPIVAVSASGDTCVACSASGRVYAWGGGLGAFPQVMGAGVGGLDWNVRSVSCGDKRWALVTRDGRVFVGSSSGEGLDEVGLPADSIARQAVCVDGGTAVLLVSGQVGFSKIKEPSELEMVKCSSSSVFHLAGGGPVVLGVGLQEGSLDLSLLFSSKSGFFIDQDQSERNPSSCARYKGFFALDRRVFASKKPERMTTKAVLGRALQWNSLSMSFLTKDGPDLEGISEMYGFILNTLTQKDFKWLEKLILPVALEILEYAPDLDAQEALQGVLVLLVNPLNHAMGKVTGALILALEKMPLASQDFVFDAIRLFVSSKVLATCLVKPALHHLDKLVGEEDWGAETRALCWYLERLHNMSSLPYQDFYAEAPQRMTSEQVIRLYGKWRRDSTEWSLFDYPFLLTADLKRRIIQGEERINQGTMAMFHGLFGQSPYFVLEVRREYILEDTLNRLFFQNKFELKKPLRIKFQGEMGLDGGGLKKEFFYLLSSQLFDLEYGMFTSCKEVNVLWFNNMSLADPAEFHLVGILVGLAIYNSTLLDVALPPLVYHKLLGRPLRYDLEELAQLDPQMARSLQALRNWEGDDMESEVCATFSVEKDHFGERVVHDLKPGGRDIFVNPGNLEEYISVYCKFVMSESITKQWGAFAAGFSVFFHPDSPSLSLFSPAELELLLVGSPVLDFAELKVNSTYEGGFSEDHQTCQAFWDILQHHMDPDQQQAFLKFVTGSPRAPIGGLKNLPFKLQRAGPDSDQLPTAHTCFNTLLIPEYSSAPKLESKLFLAIQSHEGFGLE